MLQVTHDSHFVPQLYLKQWSDDGIHLWSYRILVSHEKVPEWCYRPISGVAYQRDLYSSYVNDVDVDDFEKWLESESENPVRESIKKVLKDNNLLATDWERLAMFLGAQDVRTPSSYLESMERWRNTLPKLLEDTAQESVRILEQKQYRDEINQPMESDSPLFKNTLDIQIVSANESDSGQGYIRVEVIAGRALWLESQKLLLTKTVKALKKHKWSIVRPARGFQWFTSDHPVVKLNYYGKGDYDLKGGWGKKGANIFMPISPRHLLFTQIGDEFPDRFTLSPDQTRQFQGLIAERALRCIFAHEQLNIIKKNGPDTSILKLLVKKQINGKNGTSSKLKQRHQRINPPNPNSSQSA